VQSGLKVIVHALKHICLLCEWQLIEPIKGTHSMIQRAALSGTHTKYVDSEILVVC